MVILYNRSDGGLEDLPPEQSRWRREPGWRFRLVRAIKGRDRCSDGMLMTTVRKGLGFRLSRALLALVAMALAFGPSLDAAAHAASVAVDAGSSSRALKLLSAFDVIDDQLDHLPGNRSTNRMQVIVQLALPDVSGVEISAPVVHQLAPWTMNSSLLASRTPPPLDRPPRV